MPPIAGEVCPARDFGCGGGVDTPLDVGQQFQTERLDNADERERMRTHWKNIADKVEDALSNRP